MDRRVSMAACNTVDNIIMVASMDGAINYFEIQHPEGGNGQNGWAHDDAVPHNHPLRMDRRVSMAYDVLESLPWHDHMII